MATLTNLLSPNFTPSTQVSNFLPTVPTALTSTNTKPAQQVSVTPKPDNTNYMGILAGAQQQALAIQQQIAQLNQTQSQPQQQPQQSQPSIQDYINSITAVAPPSATQTYQGLYDQSGLQKQQADIAQKAQVTTEAQGRLNNISAQLQALNTEAQAIPIQLQQDSVGRGITAEGLKPIQADQLRANALKALPLQAQAAIIQAEVANAQGQQQLAQDLYTQAEQHFDKVFQLQMQDVQTKYEFQTGLIDKMYAYSDKQEQRQLDSLKLQAQQDFQTKQDTIAFNRQKEMEKIRQANDIAKINAQNEGKSTSSNLTAGQKDDLATMDTVISVANSVKALGEKTSWQGVGGLGAGTIAQFTAKNFGTGTADAQTLRSNIGNIQGTIAKLRGGTSFTPNEQALLETYVPTINDSPLVIKSKLDSLISFINTKKSNLVGTSTVAPKLGDVTSIDAWLNSF